MHDAPSGDELAVTTATATTGNAAKAEWVALMCLIAERDRDLYRELRAEAWDSVARSYECSKESN